MSKSTKAIFTFRVFMRTAYSLILVVSLFLTRAEAQHTRKMLPPVKPKIHWLSLEEAEEKMKLEPRKVYAEVYKQDCFECKRLEEKTLNHPEVAEYINSHFYAIRLNADSGDTLMFRGKKYGRLPEAHTHALAWEWTRKKNSYPASVYFDEQFKNPMPVSGYMDVTQMEMMLKYVADNLHKSIPFDEYKQHFKGSW